MDWQQVVVLLIGVAVLCWLLRRLWCVVRGRGAKCSTCAADCPLKRANKTESYAPRD